MKKITPDPPMHLEDTLLRVDQILRCAVATAYEAGEQLSGQQRDLAFSVMHLAEMAQALVNQSLQTIEAH
ncbi:DUF3077 domain-containing protein [Pseudomonas sp. 21LCFQ010]|uniref:DUF6124 family protein n=1 Tax=Pseudomonas sp. 21LCFQ010 TaxID=2957506 RepID=UPI002097E0AB|nr:DUF3077 domain-containing protein [Pseudomonas sp. 21LCFQ010]MCO8161602.1 DUF3077 domain-containing protein [Pseudomonas sp. 21LCFQ010]